MCLADEFKYQQAFSRIVDYTFNNGGEYCRTECVQPKAN